MVRPARTHLALGQTLPETGKAWGAIKYVSGIVYIPHSSQKQGWPRRTSSCMGLTAQAGSLWLAGLNNL